MGDQTELKYWLLQNIERFDIQIERLSWIEHLIPGHTDVLVRLKYKGQILSGWGFGDSEDLALTKALAEIFERLVLWENRFRTSNGLAAHTSIECAGQNAVNELRERDLFLCHFLTHTPLSLSHSNLIECYGLDSLHSWFSKQGVVLELRPLGDNGIVALLDGRNAHHPFGFIFGASVKDDLAAAALSASIEACRDGARLLNRGAQGPSESISIPNFMNLPNPDFSDHGRLALDLQYAESIQWFIEGSHRTSIQKSANAFTISEIRLTAPEFSDLPLKFARATSLQIQDLFLGSPHVEDVNLLRLNAFTEQNFTWDMVYKIPHPFA